MAISSDPIDVAYINSQGAVERENLARIYAVLASELLERIGESKEAEALVVKFHAHVVAGKLAYVWLVDNLAALQTKDANIQQPKNTEWIKYEMESVFMNFFKHYHALRNASPFLPITGEHAW